MKDVIRTNSVQDKISTVQGPVIRITLRQNLLTRESLVIEVNMHERECKAL